jgi:hypothetical protein
MTLCFPSKEHCLFIHLLILLPLCHFIEYNWRSSASKWPIPSSLMLFCYFHLASGHNISLVYSTLLHNVNWSMSLPLLCVFLWSNQCQCQGVTLYWIWGSCSGGYVRFYLLGYNAVLLSASCYFLAWLTLRPWIWRLCASSKRRLTSPDYMACSLCRRPSVLIFEVKALCFLWQWLIKFTVVMLDAVQNIYIYRCCINPEPWAVWHSCYKICSVWPPFTSTKTRVDKLRAVLAAVCWTFLQLLTDCDVHTAEYYFTRASSVTYGALRSVSPVENSTASRSIYYSLWITYCLIMTLNFKRQHKRETYLTCLLMRGFRLYRMFIPQPVTLFLHVSLWYLYLLPFYIPYSFFIPLNFVRRSLFLFPFLFYLL